MVAGVSCQLGRAPRYLRENRQTLTSPHMPVDDNLRLNFDWCYLPPVVADDVVSLVDMETSVPPLVESLTYQPQVAGSTVVMTMSEHRAVQVTKILEEEDD